jgi:hypothetical protein
LGVKDFELELNYGLHLCREIPSSLHQGCTPSSAACTTDHRVDRSECYQPLAQINCIGNVFGKSLDILSARFMQLQGDENGRSKEKSSRGMSRNCGYKALQAVEYL